MLQTVLDNRRSFCFRMPRIAPRAGAMPGLAVDLPAMKYEQDRISAIFNTSGPGCDRVRQQGESGERVPNGGQRRALRRSVGSPSVQEGRCRYFITSMAQTGRLIFFTILLRPRTPGRTTGAQGFSHAKSAQLSSAAFPHLPQYHRQRRSTDSFHNQGRDAGLANT